MAKRDVTSAGQKLHESAPAGLAKGPGWNDYAQRIRSELEYLNSKAPSLTVPGYDNRGQRNVSADRNRFSFDRNDPKRQRGGSISNPRFVAQGSGGRRCSICAGPHAEYRCPVPPAEQVPEVLGSLEEQRQKAAAPASYSGRGRVLVIPPGAFGSDVERVRAVLKKRHRRAQSQRKPLEGADALIAEALENAKRRRRA